jgi:hypothetical protein
MVREAFLRLVCVGAAERWARDASPAQWAGIPRCADRVQLHLIKVLRVRRGAHGKTCQLRHTRSKRRFTSEQNNVSRRFGRPIDNRTTKPAQSRKLRPVSSMNTSSSEAL